MGSKLNLSCWTLALTVLAVVLPIGLCVLVGTGGLLGALGDAAGATALARTTLVGGVLWVVDLICLVLVLAIRSLGWPESADYEEEQDE